MYHGRSSGKRGGVEKWNFLGRPSRERLLPTYNGFFLLDSTLNGSLSILAWLAQGGCDIAVE